jgi:hypothetical protein
MDPNIAYWHSALQAALAELDAATCRSLLNEAARRVMRVKAELKELGALEEISVTLLWLNTVGA